MAQWLGLPHRDQATSRGLGIPVAGRISERAVSRRDPAAHITPGSQGPIVRELGSDGVVAVCMATGRRREAG